MTVSTTMSWSEYLFPRGQPVRSKDPEKKKPEKKLVDINKLFLFGFRKKIAPSTLCMDVAKVRKPHRSVFQDATIPEQVIIVYCFLITTLLITF